MDKLVQERLAASLSYNGTEILPFLPYLLQDLWKLGSDPEEIGKLLADYAKIGKGAAILDLACGKGAVSVHLASRLGAKVKGIDIMPDFIAYARQKATEYGVDALCDFFVEDIAQSVKRERGYNVAIFGAAGDILGTKQETLAALAGTIVSGGYIIIDDAYIPDGKSGAQLFSGDYLSLGEWYKLFEKAGLLLIISRESDGLDPDNDRDYINIAKRADELAVAYPDKKEIFRQYVANQKDEYEDLKGNIVGTTFLLRKLY